MVEVMVVRRVKALIALTLAVLWLPVTMHCGLETLPGLEFLVCCTHEDATAPHEDDDCEADACAVIESGFYKLQDYEQLVAASTEVVVFECQAEPRVIVVNTTEVPRDLIVAWQFSSRAAPSPRAPSSLLL